MEAKEENKKILLLVHRSNCTYQFIEEIKRDDKQDVIHIRTYQSIEYDLLHKVNIDLCKYKYVVCDEFHYFLADAGFNCTTDVSFEYILNQPDSVIKIFMSATCDDMIKYINSVCGIETKEYSLDEDYSYIKSLTFFHKDSTMESFIEDCIKNNEKAILFIQSAQKAYRLYKKYKDYCLFNCSKSNSKYYKYVDKNKIEIMLKKEKFEESCLISTTCFDAGSNIIDEDVKHIVVDITDISSLIQCIGRRRILHDNDKINVYIKSINNQRLGGLISTLNNKIKMADYLYSHTVAEFIEEYPRKIDYTNIIYEDIANSNDDNVCIKKVNGLMYHKKKDDIELFKSMIKGYKSKDCGYEFGYCKYLAQKFGFYSVKTGRYTYRTITEDNSLETYLESHMGIVMLQVKDRKDLIDKLDVRSDGKQLKSINSLNSALEEREIAYRVEQFSTSKMINGKQKKYPSAWRIIKIGDNKEYIENYQDAV